MLSLCGTSHASDRHPGVAFASATPGKVGPFVLTSLAHVMRLTPAKLAVEVQVALATLSVIAALKTPLAVLESSLAVI